MKKLYLIRHCQPAFPGGEKQCIGSTDLPLSSQGLAQAEKLLLPPVTAVYSSPLTRCLQTARALGQPVQILDGLRELDAGAWEGLTFRQIRQQYPEAYAARGLDPTLPPPGGEEREKALARFRSALETAACQTAGDAAIVTHGGILAVFLEDSTGTWRKPGYGEIVTLLWEEGKLQCAVTANVLFYTDSQSK